MWLADAGGGLPLPAGRARFLLWDSKSDLHSATMFPEAAPLRIPGVSSLTRSALQALFGALSWLHPRLAARVALLLFTVPVCPGVNSLQRAVLRRAESLSLDFEGGQLRIYRWGHCGPVVLLAHGWSSRAARLTGFVTPLLNAGYQVIAFDAPGHGASSGWYADMLRYQRALACTTQQFGPIYSVIGHSFGGRAAMLFLSHQARPETRAAVLIGSPPHVRFMFEQFKLVLALRPDVQTMLNEEFERVFGGLPESELIGREGREPQCPVLVVHDPDDEVAPFSHAKALAQRLSRGTLLTTRDLLHCGALDDVATIQEIVRFIREQSRQ